MTIDQYCEKFIRLRWPQAGEVSVDEYRTLPSLVREIQGHFRHPTAEEDHWLLDHLQDRQACYFVVLILGKLQKIDERFFLPLIKAGVYEVDPSFNREFIEPAIKHFGRRRVMEALLDFINDGNNFEQAGAINALYWTGMKLDFPPNVPNFSIEYASPESRAAYESLADIRRQIGLRLLELFVNTDSVDVQRSIIPRLDLDPTKYPDSHKNLISKALAIARGHSDDYIRHRVEVQLGNEKRLRPLPHRKLTLEPISQKKPWWKLW